VLSGLQISESRLQVELEIADCRLWIGFQTSDCKVQIACQRDAQARSATSNSAIQEPTICNLQSALPICNLQFAIGTIQCPECQFI